MDMTVKEAFDKIMKTLIDNPTPENRLFADMLKVIIELEHRVHQLEEKST